jgi:hypothetical protein
MRTEPNLTVAEQKAQAARCACRGVDDYCPCQNTPDRVTRQYRAAERVAAIIQFCAQREEA